MALTREKKQKIIEDLKEKITKQKAMVFVDFTGLKVKDLNILRKKLKEPTKGGYPNNELKVVKKTLLNLALKRAGLEIDVKKLKGEIALVFGYRDEILPAKIIYQFSQEKSNLKILGGFFENKFWQAEEIISLAQLPTREELFAKLLQSLSAPLSNFLRILEANIKGLIYILSKIKT